MRSWKYFTSVENLKKVGETLDLPVLIVQHPDQKEFVALLESEENQTFLDTEKIKLVAKLPPFSPSALGDAEFLKEYQVRFPYIVGEMANGIATADMVIAANKAGLLGSFGAAGLMPDVILENLEKIKKVLGPENINWASNLIYSPNEPELEQKTVELYLNFPVRRVSTSAYMSLTPSLVRYAFSGIHIDQQGKIIRPNHILAKLSHPDVAKHFIAPPPQALLTELVTKQWLTESEAELASTLPVAEDITVEADSGGHTDNRPLTALFPVVLQQSRQASLDYGYQTPIRVGAAGGLGTPSALVAAFAMGAAYVLTGSINQAAVEAGVCTKAKKMLATADLTDVAMAPAADMFELGVNLQVLSRGTLFYPRAKRLYACYRQFNSLEEISPEERKILEKTIFEDDLFSVWDKTKDFFKARDPSQLELAERNPKYKMALVFRSYLGQASRWAITGDEQRVVDYQIWCGPSMGSFNRWVKESFLEEISARSVKQIAYNLLQGAAVLTRLRQLQQAKIQVPVQALVYKPRAFAEKNDL